MYPLKIYISVSLNKLHTCVTTTPVVYKMFPSLCKVPLCFFCGQLLAQVLAPGNYRSVYRHYRLV